MHDTTMRGLLVGCTMVLTISIVKGVAQVPAARAQEVEAQEAEEKGEETADSLGVWDLTLSSKLSFSQAAYNNWTEGGVNTLALTSGINGKANRVTEKWEQTYELRLSLGFLKQDTLDVRKVDDVIRLGGALQYEGSDFFSTFNPTVAAQIRTQFASGFNYDEVPDELQFQTGLLEPPVKVSDFMAPGVFTQSLGLTYDPRPWFTQRLGVSTKQTVVSIRRLRPLYGLARQRPVRVQAGLESLTEFDRELFTNVRLTSTLGLFAAFNETDELPDLRFENVLAMQVNPWLGVDVEFTALYDRDISTALQLKEVLSVGVTFVFI